MISGSATVWLFVAAAVLTLAGLLFFLRPRWLLGWLKGTAAFSFILLGVFLFLLAWDLTSYYRLSQQETVATVTIRQAGPQQWSLSLASEALPGGRQAFLLEGDQWQLDARVLRFSGPLQWLGLKPAYKLERLSGRYMALEEARNRRPTVHGLAGGGWVDFWALDQKLELPLVESQFGSATYMPLRNNAIYNVLLGQNGINAVAVNDEARSAVSNWQ